MVQSNGKGAALAFFGLELDCASVGCDDMLDEVQAQSHTLHLLRLLAPTTIEPFENSRPVFGADAHTPIAHGD